MCLVLNACCCQANGMGGLQAAFRNQGGFHMIGSGRGKIEKAEDLQKAADVAQELRLDGLIVCGGDDSNTNAAVLAEFFKSKGELTLWAVFSVLCVQWCWYPGSAD